MDRILEKLQNLLDAWAELAQTKPGAIEHDVLMERIQLLTSEHLSLMFGYKEATQKPD